ncbi:hypothetical protein PV963_29570 [Streptomyces coeruleorubidus]|uniref:hypothetical protein n=1 Tax=Streptomyces coeruleorubidus TaxID=116188 RepID=UPI00237F066C|nr:hypothetical protein [Streptomyces coeruleorubidus]WDV54211.1 hypothetical protein PV963_29570 [Streptomyces coeruleorubidus]
MIRSAVRGVAVTALTTTLALLPTLAHAEGKDKDNDIERLELTGISKLDTSPSRFVEGDSWTTHLALYTPEKKTGKKVKKSNKKQLRYAGDGESECSAVHVDTDPLTDQKRLTAQCTRVLRLKKGTLTLSDMITYHPCKRVTAKTAIIGGTGHYRSAYGDGYITLDGRHVHLELNVDE